MIGDRPVAPDGLHVETWKDGSVHEVSAELGHCLVRDQWARAVTGPAEQKVVRPEETNDATTPDETPASGNGRGKGKGKGRGRGR